ncbi:hypothetical protein J1N35_015151 [Gossypium stocksii]|uniref:Uncharacterized protein n=1 Tax=Gossypium stocksii TaxID=47602 RepID=A0A9D3VVD0_9ROSI|nr:hypothetical protein J1N35_015151 [Gossypium stocksii]
MKEFCSMKVINLGEVTDETLNGGGQKMTNTSPEGDGLSNDNDVYGLWMIFERRNRRNPRILERLTPELIGNWLSSLDLSVYTPSLKNPKQAFSLGHVKVVGQNAITRAKEPKGKGKVGHIDVSIGSVLALVAQGIIDSNDNRLGFINLLDRRGFIKVTDYGMV